MDEIAATVVLGGREKADGCGLLLRPEVADGQTAEEQRADGVIEVVEEDGRGGVGVRLFPLLPLTSGQMPTGRTASVESVL